MAKQANPGDDVVLLEARTIAFGASGRNGGFISESLTHGLAHGVSMWPDEMDTLRRLGRENFSAIETVVNENGIDADLRRCGKTVLAVMPHQVEALRSATHLHRAYGEQAEFLDREAARADVASPTYLAGMRIRSGGGPRRPGAPVLGAAAGRG